VNKSLLTNLVAAAAALIGYLLPSDVLRSIGVFALSGALTNWVAIYMLFDRVPGLYGSGVIPMRFEDFKTGIHSLIMDQFFTKGNVERLLRAGTVDDATVDVEKLKDAVDYGHIFGRIQDAVMASKFGSAIGMFGGANALEALRAPMEKTLRDVVGQVATSPAFLTALSAGITGPAVTEGIVSKVDHIVRARLDELTPEDVKRIVQDMIRRHLGWLVVWGGVFGAVIGFLYAVV
jgi:uncharacterized membrane-anchored protein YjiN (DUF445 family)